MTRKSKWRSDKESIVMVFGFEFESPLRTFFGQVGVVVAGR